MPSVYAYVRFSSDRQKDGDSITRQTVAIEGFCQKHGLPVPPPGNWIENLGKSAYHGTNRKTGELSKFIARLINGEIEPGAGMLRYKDSCFKWSCKGCGAWTPFDKEEAHDRLGPNYPM